MVRARYLPWRITPERYRSRFLKPYPSFVGRRAVYLTPAQHERLSALLRELAPAGGSVSSVVRNLVAAHLEEYRYPLQRWTRGRC